MIVIVADDLTGANDTGVQYRKNERSAIVKIDGSGFFSSEHYQQYDVLSINMDTRHLTPEAAYQNTYAIVSDIDKRLEVDYYYKKMDSLIRGNPVQEINAVMDAAQIHLAVVAPSFPENERFVSNGVLNAPCGTSINLLELFQMQTNKKTALITVQDLHQGIVATKEKIQALIAQKVEVLIFDATSNEDLRIIKHACNEIAQPIVYCGSAGFAKQLSEPVITQKRRLPILFVAGTRRSETVNQVKETIKQYNAPLVMLDVKKLTHDSDTSVSWHCAQQIRQYAAKGEQLVILAVSSLFEQDDESAHPPELLIKEAALIAQTLGDIVKEVHLDTSIETIISTGGDTSMQICKGLNAIGIELIDEIIPGIPVGKIVGEQAEPILIVTKSGAFGNETAVIEVLEYLQNKTREAALC